MILEIRRSAAKATYLRAGHNCCTITLKLLQRHDPCTSPNSEGSGRTDRAAVGRRLQPARCPWWKRERYQRISDDVKRHKISFRSENEPIRSGLSKEAKMILCCHLAGENTVYEDIIKRGVNLNEMETERTLIEGLYADCGIFNADNNDRHNRIIGDSYWQGVLGDAAVSKNGRKTVEWHTLRIEEERCSLFLLQYF